MIADEAEIGALVRVASERRRVHLSGMTQDAWRVVNGPADGAPPGLALDRYSDWLVLLAREEVGSGSRLAWADAALDVLGADGLVLKVLAREPMKSTSRVYRGRLEAESIRVREEDAVFLCDLDDGIATGLYIDLHDVRRFVRGLVNGSRVLNLFAYTCAFSVHAALAGAAQVTSVDVSRRALRRGRENMAQSGVQPDRHRWIDEDVLGYLGRARRRSESYGLVIVDPPAFGRANGRSFSLARDLERLIAHSAQLVEPGGALVLSLHSAIADEARIDRTVQSALAVTGRSASVLARLGLPAWDHPTVPGVHGDRGDYLTVLVLGFA